MSGTSIWGVSAADCTGNHPSYSHYELPGKVILSPLDLSNALQEPSGEGRSHLKAPAVTGGLQLVFFQKTFKKGGFGFFDAVELEVRQN